MDRAVQVAVYLFYFLRGGRALADALWGNGRMRRTMACSIERDVAGCSDDMVGRNVRGGGRGEGGGRVESETEESIGARFLGRSSVNLLNFY